MLWHEGIASRIRSYHVAWGQTRALYYNSDLTLSQSFQPMAVQKAVLSLAASAQRAHASCRTIFCLEDIDYSVWCSYNVVSFLQSPRELPINRPLWWVAVCLLWGFKLFCLSHCSAECNIMLYWSASLYIGFCEQQIIKPTSYLLLWQQQMPFHSHSFCGSLGHANLPYCLMSPIRTCN